MTLLALAGSHIVARIAEQGLADFCGLVTLRHGTNPISWLFIHTIGFLPSCGGAWYGGDVNCGFDALNKGRVYFLKDTYRWSSFSEYALKTTTFYLLPISYSHQSTLNLLCNHSFLPFVPSYPIKYIIQTILTSPVLVFLPTIKVRKSLEEVNLYKEDFSDGVDCCSTNEWINPLHIGIKGTLWNGLSYKIVSRVVNDPARCLKGVSYLAISFFAAQHALTTIPAFILAHRTSIIAGVILAVI